LILIIRERATHQQLKEMLKQWFVLIKIVVDIEREILAGGSEKHHECEEELLLDGSRQRDLWGGDWNPYTQKIAFESIINIRPSQNNRSMEIQSSEIRERVTQVTVRLLGGLNA